MISKAYVARSLGAQAPQRDTSSSDFKAYPNQQSSGYTPYLMATVLT